MTCCVGLVAADGSVYMGADSAGVAGYDLAVRQDPKIFRVGEFLLAFCGSFRMGQLLRFTFTPPPIAGDLDAYMVRDFVPALRACFKDGGYARKEHEVESAGLFLVGVRGRLFSVQADYQVGENAAGYGAIGCGDGVALGVLYATPQLAPAQRLQVALYGAEAWNAGVRAPFTVLALAGAVDDPAGVASAPPAPPSPLLLSAPGSSSQHPADGPPPSPGSGLGDAA